MSNDRWDKKPLTATEIEALRHKWAQVNTERETMTPEEIRALTDEVIDTYPRLLAMLQPPADAPRVCIESECSHVQNSADATTQCLEHQATIARLVADLERLSQPPAEADVDSLIADLLAACNGHPNALIPWPHRLLHRAIDALRAKYQPPTDAEVLEAAEAIETDMVTHLYTTEKHLRTLLSHVRAVQTPRLTEEQVDAVMLAEETLRYYGRSRRLRSAFPALFGKEE